MPESDNLPTRVRDLRKRRGLTLRDAADQIGMSFNTLTRIEQGKNYEVRHREPILRWLATDDGSCVTCGHIYPPARRQFCDFVEGPTQARCHKEPDHEGPHNGWGHYPGQLVSWPSESSSTPGLGEQS